MSNTPPSRPVLASPPRVVAIMQARMGSTRLPGKSLADLAGQPLLAQILRRVRRARIPDQLVVATTRKPEDDAIADLARNCGVAVFRGAESDLVDRFYQAAREHDAQVVVRLCADNPVYEPAEIDRIIAFHAQGTCDFAANTHNIFHNGYPDGLGAEVFSFAMLEQVWSETTDPRNREHPHTWFYENPKRFRLGTVPCPPHFRRPELVLDVNTPAELAFLRAIYEYCFPRNPDFHITDIIRWYDEVYRPASGAFVPGAAGLNP